MYNAGFVKSNKFSKNYFISGRKKGKADRKHYFIVEPDYARFLKFKREKGG